MRGLIAINEVGTVERGSNYDLLVAGHGITPEDSGKDWAVSAATLFGFHVGQELSDVIAMPSDGIARAVAGARLGRAAAALAPEILSETQMSGYTAGLWEGHQGIEDLVQTYRGDKQ